MLKFITNIFNFVNVGQSPSFLSGLFFFKFIGTWLLNGLNWLFDKFLYGIWFIVQFILGIMEAFEYMVNSFLGMDSSVDDYITVARNGDFLDTFVLTFRAVIGVSIVLLIIFTIYAIIKQEIETAQQGFAKASNDRGGLFKNLAIKIIIMLIMPLMMGFIISGTNSIVTAFNRAVKGDQNVTVAGQVLSSSTYDANKYRNYANQNKRLPIIISAYDTSEYAPDENTLLANKIASFKVQSILKTTAGNLNTNQGLTFKESLTYKNNKLSNSSNYGDYYEGFICTPEQYQVMADFVDYVERSGENFYIKALDEPDIEWKYVDSSIYDKTNHALTINYRDASDLDSDGLTNDTYTITYSMGYNVTSPISDALESIMAMLGIGKYEDKNSYKVMERDEDFVNLVQWANEKVQIKLSSTFDINVPSLWTPTDEIIVYEYYHFSSNNTLSDYTLDRLKTEGALLDAMQIVYRQYYPEADAYSPEKTIECVLINGTYYRVELSETQMDKYGNKYYVLSTDGTDFLEDSVIEINPADKKTTLKTSQHFDLNNPSTWTYTDQIIVYEYYKDLSYTNNLSKYQFSDFEWVSDVLGGVELDTYTISVTGSSTKTFVLINGTYYSVTRPNVSSNYHLVTITGSNFLVDTASSLSVYYDYKFNLSDEVTDEFGLSGLVGPETFVHTGVSDFTILEAEDAGYERYSAMSFELSKNFDYKNIETWSYRDYFYFYLYIVYPNMVESLSELQYMGVTGDFGTGTLSGDTEKSYLYRVNVGTTAAESFIYLDIDSVNMISQLNMLKYIQIDETESKIYYNTVDQDLFLTFDPTTDVLVTSSTNYRKFGFSDFMDEENITTWTVQDLLLMMLSSNGTINSVEEIKKNGYSSLAYTTTRNGNDTLYRFGKPYSEFEYNRTVYLSENAVKNKFGYNSLNNWLNLSAVDFIAKLMNTSTQNLITDFEGIISSIYTSNVNYIYRLPELIHKIVEDEFDQTTPVFNLFNSTVKYTYSNPSFNVTLPSTWNLMDVLIYHLTGTAVSSYTSNVINYNNKTYFIIGDYAVNISEGAYKSTISESYTITSSLINLTGFTNISDLIEYYNDDISNRVFDAADIEARLIKVLDAEYTYVSTNEITTDNIDDDDAIGAGQEYSYLDIVLLGVYGELKQENYTFDVYSDGLNNYIFIEDQNKYVEVSVIGNNSDILCKGTGSVTLDDTESVFVYNNTKYVAFALTDNENELVKYSTITNLDSIIYQITKSVAKKEYLVYEHEDTGYKFIQVIDSNGKYAIVEYDDDDVITKEITTINNDYNTDKQIKALYNEYYKKYYTNNLANILTQSEMSSAEIDFSGFSVDNILTWTPIRVILYVNNVMQNFSDENITAQVVQAKEANGTIKKYIHFTEYNNATGETKEHYINMTALNITINTDTMHPVETPESLFEMYLKLSLFPKIDASTISNPASELSERTTFNSFVTANLYSTTEVISNFETNYSATFSIDSIETWNWYDLLYYYYTGEVRGETAHLLYTNSAGEKYIRISYGERKEVYLKVNSSTRELFALDSQPIDFNSSTAFDALGVVYYKLTGKDGENNVTKLVIEGTSKHFYSIVDAVTGIHYGVYGLGSTASNTNSKSSEKYSYTVTDESSLFNYGVLDFLYFSCVAGLTTDYREVNSYIYTFNTVDYILFGTKYINLDIITGTYIERDDTNNKFTNKKTIGNLVSFGEGFGTNFENVLVVFPTDIPSDLVTAATAGVTNVEVSFSEHFDPSDISTWKISDFFIYYFFKRDGGSGNCFGLTNFQTIINQGYVDAKDYVLIQSDAYGNSTSTRVLVFGDGSGTMYYCNYVVFLELYQRNLVAPVLETYPDADAPIKLDLLSTSSGVANSKDHLELLIISDITSSDFEYINYYFFKTVNVDGLQSAPPSLENDINDGVAEIGKTVNIKFSSGFKIDDISTWTKLDYIIVYESTRKVTANFFDGLSFSELKNNDNYYTFFTNAAGAIQVLAINGNTYQFADDDLEIISGSVDSGDAVYTVKTLATGIVQEGTVNSYSMKIAADSYRYTVNAVDNLIFEIPNDYQSISYFIADDYDPDYVTQYIRTVDSHAARELYQIDMTNPEWSEPIVSAIVREVNWPQKLMTDMQVLYPDLNWEVLVATDGWLDTLGEFSSANATGEYISSGNSANITAAGLVLSEFFISLAKESDKGFAEYEYESVFDEDTIKSLMLAMLGEYSYEQLSFQAKIFMDLFNSSFAPVLEDIAREKSIEIVDGKVDNFVMSVYKSYLATVILSSDFGEYLFKVATRVYAQYSIYEFLANASGDYAGYYAYINGHRDEEGNKIDAFTYSSFYELVKYENNISKTKTPTFTFNYANVYRALIDKNATDDQIKVSISRKDGSVLTKLVIERVLNTYTTWDTDKVFEILNVESVNDVISSDIIVKIASLLPGVYLDDLYITTKSYEEVLLALDDYYEDKYMNGKTIPDNDRVYCFMLEAYWSMKYEYKLTGSSIKLFPGYLQLYYKYIMGEIERWSIMEGISIDDTAKYMKYYELYNAQLALGKVQMLTAMIPLFTVQEVDIKVDTDDGINSLKDLINSVDMSIATPYAMLYNVFNTSNIYRSELKTALTNSISVIYWAEKSQRGDNESWLNILEVAEATNNILEEFARVKALSPGDITENGSTKVDTYSDELYENTYNILSDYNQKFQNYVTAQKMVDKVTKGSITYTLAQFGHNYVSAGYEFVIENRNYTLQSTVSSLRLAEYVYGGDYLVQFEVNPTFTSSTFEGIAEHVMAFDPKTNSVKAKLEIWEELREFAKEIADYTAELYFTTNMVDLSSNISDDIGMSEYIMVETSTGYQRITLEYAILEYLLLSEDIDISADTFIRLIFGDTVQTLSNLNVDNSSDVMHLAKYLEGDRDSSNKFAALEYNPENLEYKKISTLAEYLRYVISPSYNNYGYYNVDNNDANDRIHLMFVNVMKYFMINEGDDGKSEKAVSFENLNFKKFKAMVIEFLVDYQQNPSETPTENASRYLALFNLVNSEFQYSLGDTNTSPSENYGRTISKLYTVRDNSGEVKYTDGIYVKYIFAEFSVDAATKNAILGLAGVANRPIEDLVNLEYDELYDRKGYYDEALGDTFVACFYDEVKGKYIPYMGTNVTGYNSNGNYAKYVNDYGYRIFTDYYDDDRTLHEAYPIVVKGILTAAGHPTAIKVEDYEVKFYRTNITATATLNDGALQQTKVTHESNTVGFTNYVDTSYSGAGFKNDNAMYIGSADMSYFLESDFSVQMIQINKVYNLSKDEYGGISVLDDFSAFYKMETQSYLLLFLAFIVMIPMLFKATASVLRRVLDMLFLILVAPISIAGSGLNIEEGGGSTKQNKMFSTWKDYTVQTVLSVFGYVIGFNIYYVLVTTITNMTFVSNTTVLKVQAIGGLSFVTGPLLNSVVRYAFLLAAGGSIKTAARTLGTIVSAGKVQNSFASALGEGKDVMASVGEVVGDVKKMASNAKDVITGKALIKAKDFAIESAKQMIPGGEIIEGAMNKVSQAKNYIASKALSKYAQAHGVPKEVADKAAKQFRDNANAQREMKQEQRRQNAREFQQFMGVDKEGLMDEKSSKAKRKEREEKQKKKEDSFNKAAGKKQEKTEKKNKKKAKKKK